MDLILHQYLRKIFNLPTWGGGGGGRGGAGGGGGGGRGLSNFEKKSNKVNGTPSHFFQNDYKHVIMNMIMVI